MRPEEKMKKQPEAKDLQLVILFAILGGLTIAILFLMKLVLFGPSLHFIEAATR